MSEKIRQLWKILYGEESTVLNQLEAFITEKASLYTLNPPVENWYTFGPVYCVYPDAFPGGFKGLSSRAEALKDLGITVLWLLPCLSSPGQDQGFDISDYSQTDPRYGSGEDFDHLLQTFHGVGIRVIFDIAINHSSDQHPWFLSAKKGPQSPYRDYYHWAEDDKGYPQADLIFKGMVNSNWTLNPDDGTYYFHRFYPFQPDLNYTNPHLISEMIRTLVEWKLRGVDGFRMDAAPCLWKEEGTDCMNRPQVHTILKLFRACLDVISPGTLFLAEANIPTDDLLEFFGQGDECQSAYNFPLLPKFYQAIHAQDPKVLIQAEFPALPPGGTWITFLRLHDEVTLDLVPPEERPALVHHFAPDHSLRFRGGEAFSGRLFNLLENSPQCVLAAYSGLFSLPGTPLIYYGDEIAMENNRTYYEKISQETGYPDSRFFHRGPFDLIRETQALSSIKSQNPPPARTVLDGLKEMLHFRREHREEFNREPILEVEGKLLISRRGNLTLVTNFSNLPQTYQGQTVEPWGRLWNKG